MKERRIQIEQKARTKEVLRVLGVCFFLALAVLLVFGQTRTFNFVGYDDGENVFQNEVVRRGLAANSVGWALTHSQTGNWIPLTTLSHMLDCQLFGLQAGGHHLVNVFWHAANAILLFLLLRQLTGSLWRSAFVAALFAVHPLRAESVAWVSERKDVLSGFFFMLTIGAYVRYAKEFNPPPPRRWRAGVYYAVSLLCFALGLMAKSMVATLPFILLLLDYWPLQRWRGVKDGPGLIREKIPFFVLAGATCLATALVPGLLIAGAVRISLWERVANALVSYVVYLRQMIWPAGLAAPYPLAAHPQPFGEVCLAIMLLAAITATVVVLRRKRPVLLVGWLWYVGMLFPVIGIIQISADAAHADRYTYLPGIGLLMAATWAVADWSVGWAHRREVLGAVAVVVLGALSWSGNKQVANWRDDESLWQRALACTSSNSLACNNLGTVLANRGQLTGAIELYRKSLAINPSYVTARNNLGKSLAKAGRLDEAIAQFQQALQFDPKAEAVRFDLGAALSEKGETETAMAQYRAVLEMDPRYAEAHLNLGGLLAKSGRSDEALEEYGKAVQFAPENGAARGMLAIALFQKGEKKEAIAQYRKEIEIDPADPEVRCNLAVALLDQGQSEEAVTQCGKALQLDHHSARAESVMGNALAAQGRMQDAAAHFRRAVAFKPNDAVAHFGLGSVLFEQNEWKGAITEYRQALNLQPDFANARRCLGNALLRKGDFDAARACLQGVATVGGDLSANWRDLGDDFQQKGELEEAIICFEQASKIDPGSCDTLANLGVAFFQKGAIRKAIESLQQSLESSQTRSMSRTIWPGCSPPHPMRPFAMAPKQLLWPTKANELDRGGNPMVLHTLAAAYAESGRYGEATATARRALELAVEQKNGDLTGKLPKEIKLYQADQPLRDIPQ